MAQRNQKITPRILPRIRQNPRTILEEQQAIASVLAPFRPYPQGNQRYQYPNIDDMVVEPSEGTLQELYESRLAETMGRQPRVQYKDSVQMEQPSRFPGTKRALREAQQWEQGIAADEEGYLREHGVLGAGARIVGGLSLRGWNMMSLAAKEALLGVDPGASNEERSQAVANYEAKLQALQRADEEYQSRTGQPSTPDQAAAGQQQAPTDQAQIPSAQPPGPGDDMIRQQVVGRQQKVAAQRTATEEYRERINSLKDRIGTHGGAMATYGKDGPMVGRAFVERDPARFVDKAAPDYEREAELARMGRLQTPTMDPRHGTGVDVYGRDGAQEAYATHMQAIMGDRRDGVAPEAPEMRGQYAAALGRLIHGEAAMTPRQEEKDPRLGGITSPARLQTERERLRREDAAAAKEEADSPAALVREKMRADQANFDRSMVEFGKKTEAAIALEEKKIEAQSNMTAGEIARQQQVEAREFGQRHGQNEQDIYIDDQNATQAMINGKEEDLVRLQKTLIPKRKSILVGEFGSKEQKEVGERYDNIIAGLTPAERQIFMMTLKTALTTEKIKGTKERRKALISILERAEGMAEAKDESL
jgi:hypothetical protein